MKKIIALILAVLTLASLAACVYPEETKTQQIASEPVETAKETPDDVQPSTKIPPDLLDSFVDSNKIYFDLHITPESIKDFSLTVGEETLTESKQIAFNVGDTIVQNGEPVEGKKFTIYILRQYSDEGSISVEHFIHIGVYASKVGDLLAKVYSRVANSTRVYIAVLETSDGWDHNLSAKLNEYLDSIKPAQPAQ